jgi:hypothetical protein
MHHGHDFKTKNDCQASNFADELFYSWLELPSAAARKRNIGIRKVDPGPTRVTSVPEENMQGRGEK